jgi:DNA-binding MarR family transcriptional regulator
VVRVDHDFVDEYPEADASCTEAFATLLVVGDVLMALHEPPIEATLGASQTVAQALAVLDGAGEPLTPSQIGERLLVSSATMTSLLDTLEQRDWVRRTPNPDDRRSLLIEITDAGRAMTDVLIPGLHKLERRVMSGLNADERDQLLGLLGRVLDRANEVMAEPLEPLSGVRHRPTRLG